jgi:hypothetical protein
VTKSSTTRRAGDTVINATQGPIVATATVPRNPIRNGQQGSVRIIVYTPLGYSVNAGLSGYGGSGRVVCTVVSCDPRPVAAPR